MSLLILTRADREGTERSRHGIRNAEKLACHRGHLFDTVNTYTFRGHRQCRKCARVTKAAYKQRVRSAA